MNNIVILENFVDLEDLKKIQDFLPTINEWDNLCSHESFDLRNKSDILYWKDRQCSGDIILKLDKEIYDIVNKYILKMKLYLEDRFKVELSSNNNPTIVKWNIGQEMSPHADGYDLSGKKYGGQNYAISCILYLNDDFDGGELYYTNQDIEIKPVAGMCVAHPSTLCYTHGVKKITSNNRWTSPFYFS